MYLESKPSDSSREISKSLYCECRVREFCSPSVGLCLCSHVFSRTVAAVDTKRGYVGMSIVIICESIDFKSTYIHVCKMGGAQHYIWQLHFK